MKEKETETIKAGDSKDIVKSRYDACAEQGGGEGAVCCAGDTPASPSFAAEHGLYSREELSLVPKIAFTLSRGCGNPAGFADLQLGEVVVDISYGGAFYAFVPASRLGLDLATSPTSKIADVAFAVSGLYPSEVSGSDWYCQYEKTHTTTTR